MPEPRLRHAEKYPPPYELNSFPDEFAHAVGKEILALYATQQRASLEGPDWERIFAAAINGEWKPSNVGLDDIQLRNCAWGAKTVKNSDPFQTNRLRLISGRNNPEYSFKEIAKTPAGIGRQVLDIWNARVSELRARFRHLRSVVLIKPSNMEVAFLDFAVFEFETVRYMPEDFSWSKNKNDNYIAVETKSGMHRFTWQRHGSQFTILEDVPKERLCLRLHHPPMISSAEVLKSISFKPDWIQVWKPK